MRRIQTVSMWIRLCFQWQRGVVAFAMIALPLADLAENRAAIELISGFLGWHVPGHESSSSLPLPARVLVLVGWLVACGLLLRWVSHGIGLFKLYERGILFSEDNVRCFRGLGRIPLVWAVIKPIYALIASRLVLADADAEFRVFDFIDLGLAEQGLLILLIAWVMDEGRKLREASQLVI